MYDPNDRDQVRLARAKEKLNLDGESSDLKKILSMPEGRRVIYKYLTFCGVYKSSIGSNANMTYVNEGQRNVGLFIIDDMNKVFPDAYLLMLKENRTEGTIE